MLSASHVAGVRAVTKTLTVTLTTRRGQRYIYLPFWQAVDELWRLVPVRDRKAINEIQWREVQKQDQELEREEPQDWSLFTWEEKKRLAIPRVITWQTLRTYLLLPLLIKVIESGELSVWAEDPATNKTKKLPKRIFGHGKIDPGLPSQGKAKVRSRDGTVIYERILVLKKDLRKIRAKHLAPYNKTQADWHKDKAAVLRKLEKWLKKFISDDIAYHEERGEMTEPHTKEWILERARREVSVGVTMGMVRRVWKLTPPEWRKPGRRKKQ